MIIALTGASGFIGSRLLPELLARGHSVRALCRHPIPARAGLVAVPGSLSDAQALRTLVRGSDAVLHLAASVRGATEADFATPNVAGSENLLAAIADVAPGTPVLYLSSLAAREPGLSHYAASKRAAEALFASMPQGAPALVLRPPAVYGPGDREMLPVFRFMARTGLAPCAGRRGDRLSLLFVDDLVEAMLAWLERGLGLSGCCTLHDGRDGGYDWEALAAIAGDACGRRVRVWEVPRALLDAAAWLNPPLCRLGGRLPMLSPGKLRELRHPDWSCDNEAICSLLGWSPRTGLAAGLDRTPGWSG